MPCATPRRRARRARRWWARQAAAAAAPAKAALRRRRRRRRLRLWRPRFRRRERQWRRVPTETATAQLPRLRRGAPPTCEPTVTCEAYRYEVFRKPEPAPRDPIDPQGDPGTVILGSLAGLFERLEGEMAARIACCLRELEAALPRAPGNFASITLADRQAWFRWCCAVRSSLTAYFGRIGGTDCETLDRIAAVRCPTPSCRSTISAWRSPGRCSALLGPTLEAMLHCICTNVLPPCPAPEDPRVPLAVVTIRRRDCHVVKVCNWTPLRRHVVTLPTLGYWLGWFPLGAHPARLHGAALLPQLRLRRSRRGPPAAGRRRRHRRQRSRRSRSANAPAGVDFRFDRPPVRSSSRRWPAADLRSGRDGRGDADAGGPLRPRASAVRPTCCPTASRPRTRSR